MQRLCILFMFSFSHMLNECLALIFFFLSPLLTVLSPSTVCSHFTTVPFISYLSALQTHLVCHSPVIPPLTALPTNHTYYNITASTVFGMSLLVS